MLTRHHDLEPVRAMLSHERIGGTVRALQPLSKAPGGGI
jgi:hypothetical protein